jgi:hypothetical protein
MKKNPQQSYVQLLNSIRDELATKYTQKPQLSCSHPLSKLGDVSLVMLSGTDFFLRRYQLTLCNVDKSTDASEASMREYGNIKGIWSVG